MARYQIQNKGIYFVLHFTYHPHCHGCLSCCYCDYCCCYFSTYKACWGTTIDYAIDDFVCLIQNVFALLY